MRNAECGFRNADCGMQNEEIAREVGFSQRRDRKGAGTIADCGLRNEEITGDVEDPTSRGL